MWPEKLKVSTILNKAAGYKIENALLRLITRRLMKRFLILNPSSIWSLVTSHPGIYLVYYCYLM